MVKFIGKRSEKTGLPPGVAIHIGERWGEKARITVIEYDDLRLQERELALDECQVLESQSAVTWVNVDGIHQVEVVERLGACLGLHPLVVEDILNTYQRPKVEDFDEYIYVVLKMLQYDHESNGVTAEQVSLVLGPRLVASFQEKQGDVFEPIRERLRNSKGRIRKMGADYLAYALLDAVVDNYFVVLEELGERIEFLEEEVVADPVPETLQRAHLLKREMVLLRRSVWPLREAVSSLERSESPLIQESTDLYLRDVYDHTIQVIDAVETFRDIVSGMLDTYLSSVSNKMNEVMKVLTIIATIFIPLTLVAGIYGMNFRYMPELEWRWGYPAVWLVMVLVSGLMLIYFRKRRWL
jgi:magnesium transporter